MMTGKIAEQLKQHVEAELLQADPAQTEAASALDMLLFQLAERQAATSAAGWLLGRLKQKPAPLGLYLWGGVGRGKTMLMELFAEAARQFCRKPVLRYHFHDFMAELHDRTAAATGQTTAKQPHKRHSGSRKPKQTADDPAAMAVDAMLGAADLVCFDEMEVRDIADAMILARSLGRYLERGGVLVATSNRHPDELYAGGLHRDRFLPFISLLKNRVIIHELASMHDWRQRVLAGMDGYFCPDDATAAEQLDRLFGRLAGGVAAQPVTLTVAGRALVMPAAAGGVGRADFATLCEAPLAARDYLAIAERFAGLVLEHVPQLDDSRRNETRRLMWLIDALYDRSRFLLCSAAAPPQLLYQGRQWAADFPRTASRLGEMTKLTM